MVLTSRKVIEGPARAPHRAMFKAMGLKDQDLEKPLVGVSSTCNEVTPCNIHLGKLAQTVKQGIKDADCTPREFTTIAVSDGIAMGHEGMKASLVSREIIADSIEIMMRAHQYDALVGISGCDKSLPGSLMAMARINLPRKCGMSICWLMRWHVYCQHYGFYKRGNWNVVARKCFATG